MGYDMPISQFSTILPDDFPQRIPKESLCIDVTDYKENEGKIRFIFEKAQALGFEAEGYVYMKQLLYGGGKQLNLIILTPKNSNVPFNLSLIEEEYKNNLQVSQKRANPLGYLIETINTMYLFAMKKYHLSKM